MQKEDFINGKAGEIIYENTKIAKIRNWQAYIYTPQDGPRKYSVNLKAIIIKNDKVKQMSDIKGFITVVLVGANKTCRVKGLFSKVNEQHPNIAGSFEVASLLEEFE